MDNPRLLRVILFGIVLASLTLGYLFFTGKFSKPQTPKTQTIVQTPTQNQNQAPTASSIPVPTPYVLTGSAPTPIPTSKPVASSAPSAYQAIANRAQNQVTVLPKTGIPDFLLIAVGLGGAVSGWFLRKFPE